MLAALSLRGAIMREEADIVHAHTGHAVALAAMATIGHARAHGAHAPRELPAQAQSGIDVEVRARGRDDRRVPGHGRMRWCRAASSPRASRWPTAAWISRA